jgi:C-terminal processing protease CtpA/Prc
MDASAQRLGRHQPPVLLRFVEGRTMVASLVEANTGLQVGDVLERIDGEPVEARRAFIGQYYSASTPQAWQRNLHRNLLRGQAGSTLRLDVRGLDGKPRTVALKRTLGPEDTRLYEAESRARPQPVFGVLASGLGYVDLARLTPAQVDDMFEAIAATPGTIFDMRGYPNGTAWSIAPRLGTRDAPVGALFRRTLYETDDPEQGLSSLEFEQRVPPAGGATRYRGKVVMLINEFAQSQAEHTGLFFEAATDVTFIGTPTAGANGDITYLVLPGGYSFTFSGHDVRHADGRQLQRLGLQPDVPVAPTIAGLARGDDEVLAAAERWLLEHPKP